MEEADARNREVAAWAVRGASNEEAGTRVTRCGWESAGVGEERCMLTAGVEAVGVAEAAVAPVIASAGRSQVCGRDA